MATRFMLKFEKKAGNITRARQIHTTKRLISMNVIYVQDDGQRDRRDDVNFSPLLEQFHACLFQVACRKEGEHVSRNHPRGL